MEYKTGIKLIDMTKKNIAAWLCLFSIVGFQYQVFGILNDDPPDRTGPPTPGLWACYFLCVIFIYFCQLSPIIVAPEGIVYPRLMGLKKELIPWEQLSYRVCKDDVYQKKLIEEDTIYNYAIYYAKRKCKLHTWMSWINPFSGCQILLTPSIAQLLSQFDEKSAVILKNIVNGNDESLLVSYEDGHKEYEKYLKISPIYQCVVLSLSLIFMLYEINAFVVLGLIFATVIVLAFLEGAFKEKYRHHCKEAYYHELIRKAGL